MAVAVALRPRTKRGDAITALEDAASATSRRQDAGASHQARRRAGSLDLKQPAAAPPRHSLRLAGAPPSASALAPPPPMTTAAPDHSSAALAPPLLRFQSQVLAPATLPVQLRASSTDIGRLPHPSLHAPMQHNWAATASSAAGGEQKTPSTCSTRCLQGKQHKEGIGVIPAIYEHAKFL